ncbi:MAG: polysaccharide lyase [Solirubrobacteraceae bacterium]|nr:polysaccharide lyase [Solirubrobacteraceae bacterium]
MLLLSSLVLAAPASAAIYFATNYAGLGLKSWQGVHQPANTERVSIVNGFAGMPGKVLKAEVRPGDKTYTGTYVAERSEVYGRMGTNYKIPTGYPDPVGSTRWYAFNINLKPGFEVPPHGDTRWVEVTQWKGVNGSVPPIGIMAQWDRLKLKVLRSADQPVIDIGGANRGSWIRFSIGVKWSTGNDGWIQVFRDGKEIVPRFSTPTMQIINGIPDAVYFKQGIYRGAGFTTTHTAYFSDVKIGSYRPEIDLPLLR